MPGPKGREGGEAGGAEAVDGKQMWGGQEAAVVLILPLTQPKGQGNSHSSHLPSPPFCI